MRHVEASRARHAELVGRRDPPRSPVPPTLRCRRPCGTRPGDASLPLRARGVTLSQAEHAALPCAAGRGEGEGGSIAGAVGGAERVWCGSVERVALSAGVRRVRVESSVCVCVELGRQEARCGRWVSAQGAAVSIDRGMCQYVDPRSCTALGGSYWRGRTSHRHRAISLTEVHGHHIFRRGY